MPNTLAPKQYIPASPKQIDFLRSLAADREPFDGWEIISHLVESGEIAYGVARFAIDRFLKAPYKAKRQVEPGFYSLLEYIYEVRISEAGRAYALEVYQDANGKICKEYAPGAVRFLTPHHALTLEEAKAFGRETGSCCICGRVLTNPESIEKGIGPICEQGF